MGNKYVVKLWESDKSTGPESFQRYLQAICHQPYRDGSSYRATTDDVSEAFVFQERAAAEVAAVWVGGEVVSI